MPKLFEKADDKLLSRVRQVFKEYYDRLLEPTIEQSVTVETMLVYGPRNKNGDITGPAIEVHGREAFACIRVTKLEERVAGRADAVLHIDGDRWPRIPVPSQDALIDHELTHLELVLDPKSGQIQFDDAKRVRIKIRKHDFQVGWFNEVAQRHKSKSLEVIQAQELVSDEFRQLYFPEWDITPATKKKRA